MMIAVLFFSVSLQTVHFGNVKILSPFCQETTTTLAATTVRRRRY